jgi:nitroimidazol reductase NimA-like FMN-containing flavoprotein (pyridoxamine 5'-phosphate oxidase superfamily)
MDESEISEFLKSSHTGVLATLRSDGAPAIVPLWFVVIDGHVCVRTLRASAKAKHLINDPRLSFLVESGKAWAQLKAVVLYGVGELKAGQRQLEVSVRLNRLLRAGGGQSLGGDSRVYDAAPLTCKCLAPARHTG